jgi:phage-related baseplate assembly protein
VSVLLPARRFDVVDMSALPRPDAIETWSFEAILAARIAKFLAYWSEARAIDPELPEYDVDALETDPAKILQRVDAFREGLVRQRVNDAVRATYLLLAQQDADVEARALEYNTVRAPGETLASLKLRALLAWENLSIGGSYGGYEYQARSVAPADILDCVVYGHDDAPGLTRGEVRIVILGAGGRGVTPPALLSRVRARFNGPGRRSSVKVNDLVTASAANPIGYAIDATLVIPRGADADVVLAEQRRSAARYAAYQHRIGGFVTPSGVLDAIGADNPRVVRDVRMRAPFQGAIDLAAPPRIGGGAYDAPTCTGVTLDVEVAA